jgi:protein TonB
MLCTLIKDYLVRWEIVGWSKQAIETAVSTLQTITPAPPITPPITQQESVQSPTKKVQVPAGMSTGLLIKKVQPVYPPEARYTHIQGSVVLEAVINKVGDVVDLEVISGPRELVPSAVNAVRMWKYRPYLLNGEPVAVQTSVIVNYELRY